MYKDREYKIQLHVPCRNEERRLPRFIDSLRAQTFTDFQVIFHNNASTDRTEEIVREYQESELFGRVHVHNYKTAAGGLEYGQRIRWFPHCSEYISQRSANDLISPDYLKKCIEILDSDSRVGLAYSNGYLVYEDDPTVGYHSKDIEVRTNVDDLESSVANCVDRYTQSFALWGVYRRSVFEALSSWRLTCYGADHVHICESSLYGSVVSTEAPLDIRVVRGSKESQSSYDDIRSMWNSHHLMHNAELPDGNYLMPLDRDLPFHSMMMGYIDMFRVSRVRYQLKERLIGVALEKFRRRFENILTVETESFLAKYASSHVLSDRLKADSQKIFSTDSEILHWANALAFTTPVHKKEISRFLSALRNIQGSEL